MLLFDRASWPDGEESLWVRQSRPYAGDTYGLHLPLLAGTEVAIGFEHGDHVTIRNYRRNVLRTPANNKIRLDDTRGQEHIKISTEYGGKSQLNLGHLVDSQNLISTAGKNADISVVKDFFIGVGNTLSVFVRRLGMKLIANQGPVQVQAQNDLMELLARKEISIVSTEDEINITAKKKITLNGGGSYITLDANGIESATAGDYRIKAGHYERQQKASAKPEISPLANAIDDGSHNVRYLCRDDNGVPMSNTHYKAFLADGSVVEGVTDNKGYTKLFTSAQAQDILLHLTPELNYA